MIDVYGKTIGGKMFQSRNTNTIHVEGHHEASRIVGNATIGLPVKSEARNYFEWIPTEIVSEILRHVLPVQSIKVAPPSDGHSRYKTYEEKVYAIVDGVAQ